MTTISLSARKKQNNFHKLILLSISCCLIAAAYAILRPLKISVFYSIVGKEYYPLSKLLMVFVAIPSMFFYAKLVDGLKRHQIIYVLFVIYTIICFTFAALFAHPTWGISNTTASPYRLLGWFFIVCMDLYPTFVIGTIWAFINSISTPDFAKNNYGIIVASTKIGGISAAGLSLYMTTYVRETTTISLLIAFAALLLALSIVGIKILKTIIPASDLAGYKKNFNTNTNSSKGIHGIFSGLTFMITKPYVFGIFILYYCYEVIFTIVEYQSTVFFSIQTNNSAIQLSSFMFFCMITSQALGLIFSLLGTSTLLRHLSMRYALIVMPISSVLILLSIFLFPTLIVMQASLILLPALNFGFNAPVREMLYIPTSKDIQFKSKAWIDSFGRSMSKTSGSSVNMLYNVTSQSLFLAGNTIFSICIATIWGVTAYFLGKRYERIINPALKYGAKEPLSNE